MYKIEKMIFLYEKNIFWSMGILYGDEEVYGGEVRNVEMWVGFRENFRGVVNY